MQAAFSPPKNLGLVDYLPTYQAMRAWTHTRTPDTPDALWLCQHRPVYTLGLSAAQNGPSTLQGIPVVATDRGGQMTYHGPGQVVVYPLLDLKRRGYFVKEYVYRLEEATLKTLAHFGITGHRVAGAPGVYVRWDDPAGHGRLPPGYSAQNLGQVGCKLGKIAALGLKVSAKGVYHGLALNVDMDLAPFSPIAPCGYVGLQAVSLAKLSTMAGSLTHSPVSLNSAAAPVPSISCAPVAHVLTEKLLTYLAP